MTDQQAEVQTNDTEVTTHDIATEVFDELEAKERPIDKMEPKSADMPEVPELPSENVPQKEPEKAEEEQPTEQPPVEAPQEWNQQLKDALETIPTPEAKQAFIDAHKNMYRNYQADKQALAPMKQTAEMVMNHVQPLENELRMRGQTSQQYIDTVFATAQALNDDPHKTIEYLANVYNYKLQPEEDQAWVSPEQEKITALEAKIQQMEQAQTQAQTLQQQTQQQEQLATQKSQQDHVEQQFMSAKNPDGTPKHPHFSDPEVKQLTIQLATNEMQQLQQRAQLQIDQGIQPDPLTPEQVAQIDEMAYQRAVRALGKDVTEKQPAAKPQRIKATTPVDSEPDMSTKQIAMAEYDRLAG